MAFLTILGKRQAVRNLIAVGTATIGVQDTDGNSAVMMAARYGRLGILSDLIEAGAAVDGANHDGLTPLMWAARYGHAAAATTLIDAGAALELRERTHGRTALLIAVEGRWFDAANRIKRSTFLTALIGARASLDAQDDLGHTALTVASACGDYGSVTALIAAGADLNIRADGRTALQWAQLANEAAEPRHDQRTGPVGAPSSPHVVAMLQAAAIAGL